MRPVSFLRTAPQELGEIVPEDQAYIQPLSLDRELVVHPWATYFLRVGTDTHIVEDDEYAVGDVLVVDRAIMPKVGDRVLVVAEGALTYARYRTGHTTRAQVWGVVVAGVRRFQVV